MSCRHISSKKKNSCAIVSQGKPHVFQWDNTLAYIRLLMQNWLLKNILVLNPLDCYIRSVSKRESDKACHDNVDSLIRAIEKSLAKSWKEHLKRAYEWFTSWIETVVNSDGSFIRDETPNIYNKTSWNMFHTDRVFQTIWRKKSRSRCRLCPVIIQAVLLTNMRIPCTVCNLKDCVII